MSTFKINLNEREVELEAMDDTPLLWILRDNLQLMGTKFGCGKGLCGACTVHLDGEPVRSCSIPVAAIGSKRVTTIEGIATKGLHPVQASWIAEDVPQCGYCQTGQIMTVVALLNKNPNPSDEEIDKAMEGNICRCGTYVRIRKAIKRAAKQL
ncbi:MAG: (2Fe-2S)-binding protein [Cyclobacteriaceae bacterium]|nr:(2Fe-2S)-binding protein [Cyclobacteriaceae bacterium]